MIRYSFKDYLAVARVSDSPAGDFITDARRDRRFPADDIASWEDLRRYVDFASGGSDLVLDAASDAWRSYTAWRKRREAEHRSFVAALL